MDMGTAIYILRSGVLQILMMAAPILLVGMITGLIISVIQATTSIQEQTLTFVPKIAAIMSAIIVFGPWMISSMADFARRLFENISSMSG